jgi:hypothetical protein
LCLFPAINFRIAGPKGTKNLPGKTPPPDSNPFKGTEFGKNLAHLSRKFAAIVNRSFQFHKRGQFFIGPHNVTLSIVPMRVSNPDCSPLRIDG